MLMIFLLWLGSALCAQLVAESKGRTSAVWFLLAMAVPLIGALPAMLAPRRAHASQREPQLP